MNNINKALVLSGASTGNLFEAIRTGEYPFRNPISKDKLKECKNVIITDSERGYSLFIPLDSIKQITKYNSKTATFNSGDSKNQNPLRFQLNFNKAVLFTNKETMHCISNVWDSYIKADGVLGYKALVAGGVGYCDVFVNASQLRLTKCGAKKADYKVVKKK